MKKECNVVMLATDKTSVIAMNHDCKDLLFVGMNVARNEKFANNANYHLYITSNEEIKEGDYVLTPRNHIARVKEIKETYVIIEYLSFSTNKLGDFKQNNLIKIIATTDTSLKLPQPSQDFLNVFIEEYNKGNVIDKVMVKYWMPETEENSNCFIKQPKINPDNTINISLIEEEKKYSKGEVIEHLYWLRKTEFNVEGHSPEDCFDKWIKENLK